VERRIRRGHQPPTRHSDGARRARQDTAAIWSEGALAGNTDGRTEGWRVHLDVDGEGLQPEGPGLNAVGGHLVVEGLVHGGAHFQKFSAAGLLPLTVFLILLDLETFDPTANGDPMLAAGYRHGLVHMDDWEAAFNEADGHVDQQPGHTVGVIRWSSTNANRNLWD
jgi:hypothetical protein